jgi:PAS domain S-box-containing protein
MTGARTVMVVDDDQALRESVCELLEDDGYRAVGMANAATALDRLKAEADKPHLILLDLMMPGMNGWQFRAEQLGDPALAAIPVVAMTASRELQGIEVDEVIYKPVRLQRLLDVVGRHAGAPPAAPAPAAERPAPRPRSGGGAGAAEVFAGGGELGALMRAYDWASSPLGPVERWPQNLKTCVRIVLTSRQPMFVWWGEQLINLYNDAYRSIVGGKHPQALGQPASVVWREIWDQIAPRAAAAMRDNEGTYDEALRLIMHRHGYDEETYYTFSYSPVPDDDGRPGGIICANTSDTDRIVGERQMALLHELAARPAEARTVDDACAASAGALATGGRDLPFALLYLVDGATATLAGVAGVERGHPVAPATIDLTTPARWPLAAVRDGQAAPVIALAAGDDLPAGPWPRPPSQAVVMPLGWRGRDGRSAALVLALNPFRVLDDRFRDFLDLVAHQVSANLTTAYSYEQEKRRAEDLAELDRAKTAFFSNVSHEFRTPLTLMLGPSEDLLAGAHGELPDAQRGQIHLLHRNALRLQKLVDSLLDFSRIEAGRIRASYEPVDLGALTGDLASAFRSAFERAGVALVVDCPPLAGPIHVDREMWEKIVLNLLSNAFKFTFEGRVVVSLRSEGATVALRVSDTGVGVPAEHLPRLFERFHRVEGTHARTHEGSGIGLALVQELARLHGGAVGVESQVDVGTAFTVRIPTGTAHLPADRIGAPRTAASTALGTAAFVEEALRWLPRTGGPVAAPAAHARRILLADDNADMRDYVRRMLEPHYAVEAVEDGARALASARASPPDLVLTDVMMPGLDGFALLRELRADLATRDIPVVMLSARAGEEARLEGLESGAEDYLVKPFSARELLARVRTHLELAGLRTELRHEHERLYALFMQAPAPIAVVRGEELVFEVANRRYLQVCGRGDIVGKPLHDALPSLRGQGIDELLREVMRTGKSHVGRELYLELDRGGDELAPTYWTFIYAPLRRRDGVIDRVMALCIEVTDQVLARRRIEESEEKFRNIVSQVQAGIAQTDLTGRFTLVNERYTEIVGRSARELRQLRPDDITHPDDVAAVAAAFTALVETGAPLALEQRYLRPDGSFVWVQNSVSRIDVDGRPHGVATVAIDITQRKFAEQALAASQAERAARLSEVERALEFSETFVGILGHDLRSPLGAVVAATELLLIRELDERIAVPIQRIRNSADRMARMIEQILDLTRARIGGGIPVDPSPLDLRELAGQLVQEAEGAAPQPLVLDATGDTRGEWDGDRLAQVMSNLLGNAIEHGAPDEPVRLRVDGSDPAVVRIAVANGGVIPARSLETLFDPFRRDAAADKTRRSKGLGLGLYIVQQIVEAHGGRVDVRSTPADGTTFEVSIPRKARRSQVGGQRRPG